MNAPQGGKKSEVAAALKLLVDRLGEDGLQALQTVVEAHSYSMLAEVIEMVRGAGHEPA